LFTEILPLTGTNPAALMVKELVLSGKLSDVEAQRMVAFIPYYLRLPSEKLLASWEDLLKGSSSIKTKYKWNILISLLFFLFSCSNVC
jgi:hypothetical protein